MIGQSRFGWRHGYSLRDEQPVTRQVLLARLGMSGPTCGATFLFARAAQQDAIFPFPRSSVEYAGEQTFCRLASIIYVYIAAVVAASARN
jgi:hypothetical protein